MDLTAGERASSRFGVFIRLAVEPPLRCWLGIGEINPGVDVSDPAGALYAGYGEVFDVPAFSQLLNGAAERIDIKLAATNKRVLELAKFNALVKGRECKIGYAFMGADWALLGPVHWVRRYRADFIAVDVTPASTPGDATVFAATLAVGSVTTGRRRPRHSYYNDQDQQARSPGDLFCQLAVQYSAMATKTWPKF